MSQVETYPLKLNSEVPWISLKFSRSWFISHQPPTCFFFLMGDRPTRAVQNSQPPLSGEHRPTGSSDEAAEAFCRVESSEKSLGVGFLFETVLCNCFQTPNWYQLVWNSLCNFCLFAVCWSFQYWHQFDRSSCVCWRPMASRGPADQVEGPHWTFMESTDPYLSFRTISLAGLCLVSATIFMPALLVASLPLAGKLHCVTCYHVQTLSQSCVSMFSVHFPQLVIVAACIEA